MCKLLRAGTRDGSLHQLCRRPWFSRVWTLQEVILSPRPLVQCGSRVLNWGTLNDFHGRTAAGVENLNLTVICRFNLVNGRRESLRRRFGDTKFMDILVSVKKLSATNPRDKVYGCAAIFAQEGWQSPTPDYMISTVNVYIAATRSWISLFNRLNVLGLAAPANSLTGLPSWVIDWSQEHGNEQAFLRLFGLSKKLSATRGNVYQSSGPVHQLHVEHELTLCGKPVAVVQSDCFSLWHRTVGSLVIYVLL